ncbi:MAG TPA: tetratricopeptide repeat protein [Dehalococcoidia bacterium]|nr:tetratricopeptide repeat protein [Dehalococcoidia bacterium]
MGLRRWLFPNGYRAAYHYNRGTTAHRAGSLLLAEAHLREAINLWPNSPEALHNLGIVLLAQERYQEAVEAHERALSQRPRFPEAVNTYGITLAKSGRIEDAAAAFRESLRQKPHYVKAQENLDRINEIVNRHR